ncbi:DUF3237 family protein, partial [Shimwellia pseudoproteus]|uniref:DUF3237 family protein n=1 Tax=Shimwellia pseudoproteus TaxID=570012 RepID=UPI0018EDB8D1
MKPGLAFSFSIAIVVDKPIVVSNSTISGKRQLIPILGGKISGSLTGEVLPGGIDSQIIEPNGVCRLSARYALRVAEGTVYIENNGMRRVPEACKDKLFTKEGANKQVISSQADSLIKISRIWADFFPANTS